MKLQTEYGDAIQVILVHSQAASEEESIAFALRQKWLGNNAIWTSERPFSTGSSGLPSYALLGPDGRVVLVGSSNSDHSKIQKAIAAMVKEGSSAPEGTPDALSKAYRLLDEGQYAKALAETRKAAAKAQGKDEAVVAAAGALETAIQAAVDRAAERVRALAQSSFLDQAQTRWEALSKGTRGEEPLESKAAELAPLLEGPEVQQTVSAERELLRLAADAYEAGDDEKAVKKLRKFATENSGNKIGERAARLASLAEAALKIQQ